jgi:hypothetical protein
MLKQVQHDTRNFFISCLNLWQGFLSWILCAIKFSKVWIVKHSKLWQFF